MELWKKSHPVWVRGLKSLLVCDVVKCWRVAPRVGAWIEICKYKRLYVSHRRRTPCGCVD